MPILFKPQPVTGRVRITMDGTRYDMTSFIKERSDISAEWDVASNVVTATCKLTIPLSEDIYHLEAWQDFYWDSPPVTGGTYDRHIRGLIADLDSDPTTPNHIYTLKVTGGNVLLTKPPYLYVTPTTFDFNTPTTDKQIVQAILLHCYPIGTPDRIYDDGVNSHYTFSQASGHPPLTFMGMTADQALKHLQDYIAANAPGGSEIPAYVVTWRRDDSTSGDNDDWSWVLEWYTESEIGTAAIELSDQLTEDSTHAHYYGFKRHRAGLQVVNRQVAIGKNPTTGEPLSYTADDTDSQTYFGRIISAPPILNDQWTTLLQVQNAAQAELTRWREIQETLQVGPTFIPYILNAPQKVKIKRAAEGGISTPTPFALARVTLAYNAAGTPEYQLELGTSFPELGERGPGWRGGTNYNTGRSQPADPTWHTIPADDILDNTYHGNTGSTSASLTWVPNAEDNILDYYVKYSIDGAGEIFAPTTVPQSGQPTFTLTGLPPSSPTHSYTLGVSVRPRNTWGYVSEHWGPWRTITLAARDTPEPPTAVTSTAQGPDSDGFYWLDLAWTVPAVLPDHYVVRYVPHGGSYHQTRFLPVPALDLLGNPVTTVRVRELAPVNMDYALWSVTEWGDRGDESAIYTHRISPNVAPRPKPPIPPPADSTVDYPLDGWEQLSGLTPITVDDTDRFNGPAFVLAPDDRDPVSLATQPIYAKAGQVVVAKIAHTSPDTLTALAQLFEFDEFNTLVATQVVLNETTDGSRQYHEWVSAPLNTTTETVTLELDSGDATGPATHHWWMAWGIRTDDVDMGILVTPAKIAPHTDDGDRQQGFYAGTGEAAWETFYSEGGGNVVFAALNQTSGAKGLDLHDAFGNRVLQNGTGVTITSITELLLTGMVALTPHTVSANYTITTSETHVVADTTGGDITLSLPALAGVPPGSLLLIRDYFDTTFGGGGTYSCTIDPNGTEKIDGATSIDLQDNESVWIQADTTGWWTVARGAGTPTFSAQSANKVLAGPSSGSAAVPTFRYLTVDDLPFVPTSGNDIREWTLSESYQMLTVTYDGTYPTVIASATVLWPDASTGDFTTDTINTTWWAVDAYSITHDVSGLTATQSAVTRDSNGNITITPPLTVA